MSVHVIGEKNDYVKLWVDMVVFAQGNKLSLYSYF